MQIFTFSTDPDASKSKTKCLFMCGQRDPVYPAPVQLYGCDLPWVVHATHLGHELHQLCDMEFDAKTKRARFINDAVKKPLGLQILNKFLKLCKPMQDIGMGPCYVICLVTQLA